MEGKMSTEKEKFLGTSEVARRLGVRVDYVLMLLRGGTLLGQKKDGRWQVPVEAVEQRLKAREARNG